MVHLVLSGVRTHSGDRHRFQNKIRQKMHVTKTKWSNTSHDESTRHMLVSAKRNDLSWLTSRLKSNVFSIHFRYVIADKYSKEIIISNLRSWIKSFHNVSRSYHKILNSLWGKCISFHWALHERRPLFPTHREITRVVRNVKWPTATSRLFSYGTSVSSANWPTGQKWNICWKIELNTGHSLFACRIHMPNTKEWLAISDQ